MNSLSDLPNVGKVLERLLHAAGIDTPEQLREAGAREAFLRIRLADPTACLHMLYGLEGAVRGIRDTMLPGDVKQSLREFYKGTSEQKKETE